MNAKQAASFEEFLTAADTFRKGTSGKTGQSNSPSSVVPAKSKRPKEKVGLTIDPAIVEAVDDYIYEQRKQGVRLKKNDVYEAALRDFLHLKG